MADTSAEPATAMPYARLPYEGPALLDLPVAPCTWCKTRPAVIGDLYDPPHACRDCGTPCGDECCGDHLDWRWELIEAAWELRHGIA